MTEAQKQTLLQQYIDGSIDAKSRHLLEREALDDQFLFDALQGYSITTGQIPQSDLPNKDRPQIFTYMTMAASLLLIAGFSYLFNISSKSNANTDFIAINEEVESMQTSSEVDQSIAYHEQDNQGINLDGGGDRDREATTNGFKTKEVNKKSSNQKNKNKTMESEKDQISDLVENVKIPEVENTRPKSIMSKSTEDNISAAPIEAAEISFVEADRKQVEEMSSLNKSTDAVVVADQAKSLQKDSDNLPIPVSTSDIAVHEQLPSTQMTESQMKEEVAVGESEASQPMAKTSRVKKSDTAYSGNDISDKESILGANSRKSFPTGGMDKFQEYLDDNPLEKNCSQGTITFKFLILPDGTLDEIEIIDDDALNGLQPKMYAECERKARELLIDYGLWVTVPANRKVRRTWTYKPFME